MAKIKLKTILLILYVYKDIHYYTSILRNDINMYTQIHIERN